MKQTSTINEFLAFLAKDIENNPEKLKPLTTDMKARVDALIAGLDVDLNEVLLDENE